MNCPYCHCASSVLETRTRKSGVVRRTRVCIGLKGQVHKFTTEEMVYMSTLGAPKTARPKLHRNMSQLEHRKAVTALLRTGVAPVDVAKETGASTRTVHRIKAQMRETEPA